MGINDLDLEGDRIYAVGDVLHKEYYRGKRIDIKRANDVVRWFGLVRKHTFLVLTPAKPKPFFQVGYIPDFKLETLTKAIPEIVESQKKVIDDLLQHGGFDQKIKKSWQKNLDQSSNTASTI